MNYPAMNMSAAWVAAMGGVMTSGKVVQPRGKLTRELLQHTAVINMAFPVLLIRERSLSYSFMAAEALWILAGDNRLAPLEKYAKRMAEFSDDGITLDGAYGPRIVKQLEYVIDALVRDRDSRQAVMTTWERNPGKSKDVPCTVSLQFTIREAQLNCHANMRSSDLWLSVPYDVFSFTMVAAKVACSYNREIKAGMNESYVRLGQLYLTAGSSHLYEPQWEAAAKLAKEWRTTIGFLEDEGRADRVALNELVVAARWDRIEAALLSCRDRDDPIGLPDWRIRP